MKRSASFFRRSDTRYNPITKFLFVLALCLAALVPARAQTDERYRLAFTYEQSGDNRNAARLYQELHAQHPNSDLYFQGVVRSLKALNQFSSLIPLVEARLQKARSPELYALHGELLSKTGKNSEADAAWDNALSMDAGNPDIYALVAEAQIDNRSFEKAIGTFLRGRKALNNDKIFSYELSQLYSATGNFEEGTKEILKGFDESPNINLTQGQFAAFMNAADARNYIGLQLEKKAAAEPNNIYTQKLFAWYLHETDQDERSLDTYRRIDELARANGRELLNFAEGARRDTNYTVALRAFDLVMEKGKSSPFFTSALYGYVRTLEQRLQADPDIDASETQKIIGRYRTIISDYPQNSLASESQLRIALLTKNQLRDKSAAAHEFRVVLEKYPNSSSAPEATVELGDLLISLDKLDEAAGILRGVAERYCQRFPRECDRANFYLAEMEYYRGNFDSAQSLFSQLAVKTNSDISNDALSRMILLEQGKNYPDAMKKFAQAELYERQEEYSDAVENFMAVGKLSPQAEVAEQGVLRAGLIEFNRKNYAACRERFAKLLELYPESIFADRAVMLSGDAFAREGNKASAMEYYTTILTKYPRSIYVQEARTKIRKLRGDA